MASIAPAPSAAGTKNLKASKPGVYLSYLFMGAGNFFNKQIIKGLLFFAAEVLFALFMVFAGGGWIKGLVTLGTKETHYVPDPVLIERRIEGDNSMQFLFYGVLVLAVIAAFILIYVMSVKSGKKAYALLSGGKSPKTFGQDIKSLLNEKFSSTLLSVPVAGLVLFTVIPILFMVLIAFTNFDGAHQPPAKLFSWVGFENFKNLLYYDRRMSGTFMPILGWTLIWAVLVTVLNYLFGMILAMIINRKSIKLKKMWRTMFVLTIAVPQFISLLVLRNMLSEVGPVNIILQKLNIIDKPVLFFGTALSARITVIVADLWVGIPYTMLITTGILMNIPEELYESAKIDGANAVVMFIRITLPYILFITAPYLITQFIGNINNFNVIYLLSGGGPGNIDYYMAGKTDLLITWLYKLTGSDIGDNNIASTIGILVFLFCSVSSISVFMLTPAYRKEESFQ